MENLDEKIRNIVKYAYENVPSYRKKMIKMGISPNDIKGQDDMKYLPFMEKEDFRENYPYGLFAVPKEKIIRIHSTSGTTGIPSLVGFTKEDWERQCYLTSIVGKMAGIEEKDIVQIVYGFGMFTGGIGWLEGLENIGSLVIPIGPGNTKKQIEYLKQLKTSVLIGTPSYILHLAEYIKNNTDIDIIKDLNVKKILVGGEILTENIREIIKKSWQINNVTQNYGFCEGGGAGISGECVFQNGMHITDEYYPELIDPVTCENLENGKTGEIVFTSLSKKGLPLIRYRTHDITSLYYEKCDCGIEGYKMSTILGRSDSMLKIKGVCVFPRRIEEIILQDGICSPNYEIILETKDFIDYVTLKIEFNELIANYTKDFMDKYSQNLRKKIKEEVGINVNISFVEVGTLERFEGKAKRVKDLRLSRRI